MIVGDLFAGVGGMSHGFKMAGFDPGIYKNLQEFTSRRAREFVRICVGVRANLLIDKL
jgi:site-specific DNA-cytosine methylase